MMIWGKLQFLQSVILKVSEPLALVMGRMQRSRGFQLQSALYGFLQMLIPE